MLFGEDLDLRLQLLVLRLEVVDPLGGLVDLGLSLGAAPLHGLVVSGSFVLVVISGPIFLSILWVVFGFRRSRGQSLTRRSLRRFFGARSHHLANVTGKYVWFSQVTV